MKLYQATVLNTCPRRVTIYMAEKDLRCDVFTIDMRGGDGRSDWFRAMNPSGTVPVLELDDGTFLSESAAIVEYLEELFPDPPMLGRSPAERARIRSIERTATDLLIRNGMHLVNTDPGVVRRRPDFVQYPEVATFVAPARRALLASLEARSGEYEFLAGDGHPTVADCALFAAIDTGHRLSGYELPEECPRLRGWFDRFSARPSAHYPDWAAKSAQPRG